MGYPANGAAAEASAMMVAAEKWAAGAAVWSDNKAVVTTMSETPAMRTDARTPVAGIGERINRATGGKVVTVDKVTSHHIINNLQIGAEE